MTDTAGPVVAVGAVVVHHGALLMIRRGRAPQRGRWSIPGGRVEHGETLAQALAREVHEETGLEVDVGDLLGVFEVTGDDHFVILDYLAAVAGPDRPAAGGDADDVRWVPLDEIEALECTPRFVETLRGWGVLPGA